MKVVVPLRTGTGQNDREHFRARARRVKHERLAVAWMLAVHKPPPGPVTVALCRISPGNGLDTHDNLPASLKAPVDQVAEWLGRDDRDPSITWKYDQRRGKPGEWSVVIDIEATCRFQHVSQGESVLASPVKRLGFVGEDARAWVLREDAVSADYVQAGRPVVAPFRGAGEQRVSVSVNGSVHDSILPTSILANKAGQR